MRLSIEMGVVIDSPSPATRLSEVFDTANPRVAYEVRLTSDGRSIEWIEQTDSGEIRHLTEPGTGALLQLWISFLSIPPIEWLL